MIEITSRELEVIKLVADGLTDIQISRYLNICDKCAGVYVLRILRKCGFKNRVELLWNYRKHPEKFWIVKTKRELAIAMLEKGDTVSEIIQKLRISKSLVYTVRSRWEKLKARQKHG